MKRVGLLLVAITLVACNANSPENRYLLAERLLEDKKYEAAISEFQEIVGRRPHSQLGVDALLKIAQIEHLYLGRTKDAVEAYTLFLRRSKDERRRNEVERILADLQFQIFENYDNAIAAYRSLLEKNPQATDAAHYVFNIGRALSFKKDFDEAIETFSKLSKDYPDSEFAIRSKLEIGNALNMAGKCKDAIEKYEDVVKSGPEEARALAAFGQAECYEELDDLDKAYSVLGSIRKTYPSPAVIDLKMKRIKRRKILRRR